MKRGYIRPMPGLDAEAQMRAIVKAGATADTTWTEELSRAQMRKPPAAVLRAKACAIEQLRKGDLLTVANVVVLGVDRTDFLATMRAVAARQARVFDAEAGEVIDWPEQAEAAVSALERFEAARRQVQTAAAREGAAKARTLGGKRKGALKVLREADKPAAREDWRNPKMTASEIAEKYSVSVRTLYNEFKARSLTPQSPRRKRMSPRKGAKR